MKKVDKTEPQGKWNFDSEVTEVFDDMLSRSIPQYEVMRKACTDIAKLFVKPSTDIVDLGCSRGEAMAPLISEFGAYNRFIGVEVSEPMLKASRQRFEGYINAGFVDILNLDLRKDYPPALSSVTLSILTIQFTPIEHRLKILRNIWKHTIAGGCLIIVEKVLGRTAEIDNLMVSLYYELKSDHGYTQEQIERKRLSLEGILVPCQANWNEKMLYEAGFQQVDCFWRWMNFAGWIAIK